MKKNIKMILTIVITAIICISGTTYAATKYLASDITYKDTTIEKALNELYIKNYLNKYLRYDEKTKNIESYNVTLKKWVILDHYDTILPLTGELYLNGKMNVEFEKVNRTSYSGLNYAVEEDYIHLMGDTNGGGGAIFTKNTIDLTDYSKLIVEGNIVSSIYPNSSKGVYTFASESKYWGSNYEPANTKILKNTKYNVGSFKEEIDLSSISGKYYIGVGLNQCDVKITKIELK